MNKMVVTMVLAVLVLSSCVAPPAKSSAVASDTTRVSVIARALAAVEAETMTSTSQIFVANVPPQVLDEWLRASEIATAAAIEGRLEAAVSQEWDQADIHSLPVPLLASESNVWVVEIRGIRHQPPRGGVQITPAPGTPTPQPYYYDNVYVVLDAAGVIIGQGAFADAERVSPLGAPVARDAMFDEAYMVAAPVDAPLSGSTPPVRTATPAH